MIRINIVTQNEKNTIMSKEIIQVTLQSARESIVLLKNENKLLPLKRFEKLQSLVPANSKDNPLGGWDQQGIRKMLLRF